MSDLRVAVSPCPNDTFAFAGIADRHDLILEDIEDLNLRALSAGADIVKASFAVYPEIRKEYQIMPSGAAIGYGAGPVAVWLAGSRAPQRVLLPGQHTTAARLWNFYAAAKNLNPEIEYGLFSGLAQAALKSPDTVAVLIHEGRFVYESLGLSLYADLGDFWHRLTGLPLPLGGLFIKRNLPEDTKAQAALEIRDSIIASREARESNSVNWHTQVLPYIRAYAQEQTDEVILAHVDLYVTEETVNMSAAARSAILHFTGIPEADAIQNEDFFQIRS